MDHFVHYQKPSYSFWEVMHLIALCDSQDDLHLIQSLMEQEYDRYSLLDYCGLEAAVRARRLELKSPGK